MMKFKVSFQDDIRRFDPSQGDRNHSGALFRALTKFVKDSFVVCESFLLKYTDDEGELITIAHASELVEAIRIAEEEERKSLKIFVVGEAVAVSAGAEMKRGEGVAVENVSRDVPQPPPEAVDVEQEDESDRPNCEEIHGLFMLFMEDEEIKAVLPEAVKTFLTSLKEQEVEPSVMVALEAVFEAFPVIRLHEFIQSVYDKLPRFADEADKFVPMFVNLGPDFVAGLIPQILAFVEHFQNHGMAALGPIMGRFIGGGGGGSDHPMGGGHSFPMGGGHMDGHMGPMGMFHHMMAGGGGAFAPEEPQEETVDEKEIVHENVACDLCGVSPIVGVRFKCAECPNYDLCAACEAKGDPADFVGEHTLRHVMVKYRKTQDYAQWGRFFNSRFPGRGRGHRAHRHRGQGHGGHPRGHAYAQARGHAHGHHFGGMGGKGQCPRRKKDWKKDWNKDWKKDCRGKKNGGKEFKMTGVEHVTLPDGAVVLVGQQATKIWSVTNNGEKAWPEGTVLQHIKGERFTAFEVVVGVCAAGDTVQVVLDLDVMNVPGTYHAKYRLKTGKNGGKKFGRPLWIKIEVAGDQVLPQEEKEPFVPFEEPVVEQPVAEEPVVEEPVVQEPEVPEPALVAPPFEVALPAEVPELEYHYQDALNALVAMGFGNVELNKFVLDEHKGNVEQALEAILRL